MLKQARNLPILLSLVLIPGAVRGQVEPEIWLPVEPNSAYIQNLLAKESDLLPLLTDGTAAWKAFDDHAPVTRVKADILGLDIAARVGLPVIGVNANASGGAYTAMGFIGSIVPLSNNRGSIVLGLGVRVTVAFNGVNLKAQVKNLGSEIGNVQFSRFAMSIDSQSLGFRSRSLPFPAVPTSSSVVFLSELHTQTKSELERLLDATSGSEGLATVITTTNQPRGGMRPVVLAVIGKRSQLLP